MKKISLFLFAMVSLCVLTSCSNDDSTDDGKKEEEKPYEYISMLTDGKVWETGRVKFEDDGTVTNKQRYTVVGNTVINGINAKTIKVFDYDTNTEKEIIAYEKDHKIYTKDDMTGEYTVAIDFSVKNGEKVGFSLGELTAKEDFVTVNDKKFRRLTFVDAKSSAGNVVWVEGVGANNDFSLLNMMIFPPDGRKSVILECYENGKCIFERKDFEK